MADEVSWREMIHLAEGRDDIDQFYRVGGNRGNVWNQKCVKDLPFVEQVHRAMVCVGCPRDVVNPTE